jgi:flagellar biosynthetic protein FlhB
MPPGEDKHSRTEKPTPRHKKEARHQGQVARSSELVTWLIVLGGTYLIQYTVRRGYTTCTNLMSQVAGAITRPSLANDLAVAKDGATGAALTFAPAVLGAMATALLVNLAQTRGLVTFKPLKPSFSRLNPKTGLKRIFSTRSLWEAGKQIMRVILLSLIAWEGVSGALPVLTAHGPLASTSVGSVIVARAIGLAREVAEVSLVLAVLDYVYQHHKVAKAMRMSRYEIKEEGKQTEGNPFTRAAIRRRQRLISRNRMIAAVASADAVVVNPTHYAVALRYVRGKGAPKVVAKGADFLALRIREEASDHGVPLVEDPPLARALFVACDLEAEIPKELYEAVARLLTFIYSLKASGRTRRIDGAPHRPAVPLLAAR